MDINGVDQINPKKILSNAWFALFLLALIFVGSQMGIGVLVHWFYPELAKTDWYPWALTGLSLIALGLPVYLLLMKRIPDSPRGEVVKLKFSTFFVIFFITSSAMYITNILSSIITIAIALLKGQTHLLNPAQEAILNSNFVVAFVYACIIAPLVEEFIFRKVLLNKLRRFGDKPAIIMTGIAFGLFHMNLSQFFYAAVLGFIFAYITIRTNTIKYSIILHMIINTMSTAVAPFVIKGNVIVSLVMIIWQFAAILIGAVFLVLKFKHINLKKTEPIVKPEDYLVNTGVICYLSICMVMIIIITVFY